MCEHHHSAPSFWDFSAFGHWGVILSLFVMGFSGSFMHCIGMCGPFALAISQMRLMQIPSHTMTQMTKLNALLALPYYLGKAITYTLLTTLTYAVSHLLKNVPIANYLAFGFLMIVVAVFIIMGISSSVHLGGSSVTKFDWLTRLIKKYTSQINNQMGFRGIITGMILGLIPCGLVVAAITQAIALSPNLPLAIIAVFAFGMATIPGLFLISLVGSKVLGLTSKKIFKVIYGLVMFYNAYILTVYALKLI